MGLYVTGFQYPIKDNTLQYEVNDIPSGYTYESVEMPEDWTVFDFDSPSGGQQVFYLIVGVGAGTLVFKYSNGTSDVYAYFDVFTGSTRRGEEIKQDGCILIRNQNLVTPVFNTEGNLVDCPFVMNVFADLDNPDEELYNDKTDFYGNVAGIKYYADNSVSQIQLKLQKNDSYCGDGTWTDIITFADSTYGDYFAYGKHPDFSGNNFIDDYGKKYTGLFLEWVKILDEFDEGNYRMKVIYTDTFGGAITTLYDVRTFCLKKRNDYNMNKTVRIETLSEGLRGSLDNKEDQIDYSTGWKSEIRLPGIFFETKPSYNKEFNQYGEAEFNAYKPIIHELIPKFTMDIIMVPGWVDWILENNILLADEILVTDYNQSNRKTFIQCPVMNEDGIELKDDVFMNQLAWSKISFSYAQNNLRKRNS